MLRKAPFVGLAKWGIRAVPGCTVLVAFSHLVRGGFQRVDRLGWPEAGILLLLLAGIGISAARRIHPSTSDSTRLRDDLELGGGLVCASFVVVAIAGAPIFPIVYLLMGFVVAFLHRTAALTLLGASIVFDALMSLNLPGSLLTRVIPHAAFLILFTGLYHMVLTTRLAAAKRAEAEAVRKRVKEAEERARSFRLISSAVEYREEDVEGDDQWLLASVNQIEGTLGTALEVAEVALRTHTCAVFLLTPDDRFLRLYDCLSASEHLQRDKLAAGEGILGGVLKRKSPIHVHSQHRLRGLSYYSSQSMPICSVLAVPILEADGLIRGVLVADRIQNEPFTERDEKLLAASAAQVLRAIEVERVMGYIRRTRDEKVRFFRAIEELNRAGNLEQVFAAVIDSLRQLAELEFCAITLVSEHHGARVHRIAKVSGLTETGATLEGKTFPDNNGLVSNVVRYGAPLPGRELQAMDRQVIFDEDTRVRRLGVLKIFPLTAGERILGTLVAGSRTKAAFDSEVLRMIEVMALQAAQALLRAQLFEQTERMAITDGLTGLLNRRAFQARTEEALAQAKRYERKCSVVIVDIDHFKAINDTYGHPAGDLVLKAVAKIIRDKARDTDVAARYGGEEFAIVMPETDARGALVIAERIRETVGNAVLRVESALVRVTLSAGIASFPDHAKDQPSLIELADQCLYLAKRNGRNQVLGVDEMRKRKAEKVSAESPLPLSALRQG